MNSLFLLPVLLLLSPLETDILNPRPWSRDPGTLKMSVEKGDDFPKEVGENSKISLIEHTGKQDWAVSEGKRIPVEPGERYKISAWVKLAGAGNVETGVVLRDAENEPLRWSFGGMKTAGESKEWQHLENEFLIPRGIASIEPRLIGNGPAVLKYTSFRLNKTGNIDLKLKSGQGEYRLNNGKIELRLDPDAGNFSVTDLRTKRVWKQATGGDSLEWIINEISPTDNSVGLKLLATESLKTYEIELALDKERSEILVTIKGTGEMRSTLPYPGAFVSNPGDRLIIPMNEGIGIPVEEKDHGLHRMIAYGGHGICMAFWGQVEDKSGSGIMGIIETPDDASIEPLQAPANPAGSLLTIRPIWESSRGIFAYPRKIRYVFFEEGGHIAICKRYREHAKQIGLFVPFTEKVKRNPNIDKLLGAANIWCWERNRLEILRELQAAGFDRILWSAGGTAEEIKAMNAMDNVLSSRYDIYQDIMDPSRFPELKGIHGDWVTEAWPHDINWTKADGTWRKGWAVDVKEPGKERISCAVICDSKALPYAEKRISEELREKPFKGRFIDTTVAAPWFECEHPDHPMSRSDSKKHKMELLKLICDFGLVCGSETGHDASVPYCDFFEGMLSLGNYRVHESGRNMIQIIDEVPPQIERFQVNEKVRLPLWELVYHDCVVAMWYWGDYNNKLPKVWRKRDLFNALYGTPPMFMFTNENWKTNKERFIESYKTAQPVSRASAYKEMLEHRILSDDRTVQQSVFEGGLTVTVNFGEKPFKMTDGTVIAGLDWIMHEK